MGAICVSGSLAWSSNGTLHSDLCAGGVVLGGCSCIGLNDGKFCGDSVGRVAS